MIKLAGEIRASVRVGGEEAVFILRQPTNKEVSTFLSSRSRIDRRNRMQDFSTQARVEFFDKLLIGVENLEDSEGKAVGPGDADKIPVQWKVDIIFQEFEQHDIDVKNS